MKLNTFERKCQPRIDPRRLRISPKTREKLLLRSGYTIEEINAATKKATMAKDERQDSSSIRFKQWRNILSPLSQKFQSPQCSNLVDATPVVFMAIIKKNARYMMMQMPLTTK